MFSKDLLHQEDVEAKPELIAALPELSGKKLGCWCKPNPCHGDVLVDLFKVYPIIVSGLYSIA
jgi:hypothetical protein